MLTSYWLATLNFMKTCTGFEWLAFMPRPRFTWSQCTSSCGFTLRSVLLFRLLKESSRTFLFQQHKSVQLLFFVFFNVTHFVLTRHVTSPQVLPQALPPPPGENSPYSPSDRSAWFVKDYWKSARTKSERSTMRYWQQSWQVCLFFLRLLHSTIHHKYAITQATNDCFFSTEQYDAFVKFTHDQLMRRFGEQPASCEYLKPWLILNKVQISFEKWTFYKHFKLITKQKDNQ